MAPRVKSPSEKLQREFGQRFRDARGVAGLTQSDVERSTGVNKGHISEIERGLQNLTLGTMVTLAKAVGMVLMVDMHPAPAPKRRQKTSD